MPYHFNSSDRTARHSHPPANRSHHLDNLIRSIPRATHTGRSPSIQHIQIVQMIAYSEDGRRRNPDSPPELPKNRALPQSRVNHRNPPAISGNPAIRNIPHDGLNFRLKAAWKIIAVFHRKRRKVIARKVGALRILRRQRIRHRQQPSLHRLLKTLHPRISLRIPRLCRRISSIRPFINQRLGTQQPHRPIPQPTAKRTIQHPQLIFHIAPAVRAPHHAQRLQRIQRANRIGMKKTRRLVIAHDRSIKIQTHEANGLTLRIR